MTPINVSPFQTNVLDLVTRPALVTGKGEAVMIRRSMSGEFVILVAGHCSFTTYDNIEASRYLNSFELHTTH